MKEYENVNFLVDLIKGVFVGIANVIPGVSGGTMAVSFGIYDKLLEKLFYPASDHTRNGNWNCWFYLYHSVAACKLSICNFLCIYRADHRRYSSDLTFPEGRLAK